MSKKLSELGELAIVEKIRKSFPTSHPSVLRGIGDDAAAVRCRPGASLLFTVDLLVEGVHFDLATTSARDLGWKALAVNLSDIAAMGGTPRYALLALGLPARLSEVFLRDFIRGFSRAARTYATELIGGDTSSAPGVLIAVAVGGDAFSSGGIGRGGARPGDGVFVSGYPGMSALGLAVLKSGRSRGKADTRWIRSHLTPRPRITLGRELARKKLATAMIDCSDGLALDLTRIASASGVGMEIDAAVVSFPRGFAARARSLNRDPLDLALGGGEDYELIFTSPSRKWDEVKRLARGLRTGIRRIGTVTRKSAGVTIRTGEGRARPLAPSGYEHFR